MFIKSQICDQDLSWCLSSTKKVLELARFDSRAYASRPHQVLKRSLARWIKFGPSQEGGEDFTEDFKRRLESRFVLVKILFLDKM